MESRAITLELWKKIRIRGRPALCRKGRRGIEEAAEREIARKVEFEEKERSRAEHQARTQQRGKA
jgi:hypothetical protein